MTITHDQKDNKSGPSEIRALIMVEIKKFRSIPTLVANILSVIKNPKADTRDIADHMRLDPGITANVLRLANSAYFGMPRSVSSVNEAIVRLGSKRLFELIVANDISSELSKPLSGYELRPDQLLQHAVWVAVASEELCNELNICTPDLTFTAGILHDIGKIVLSSFLADYQPEIKDLLKNKNFSFEEAETAVLGISHADAGGEILSQWNFPEELVNAVKHHHNPSKAGSNRHIADIVHVADSIAYTQGVGAGFDGLHYNISIESTNFLNLSNNNVEFVASETLGRMLELQDLLCGSTGA